MIVMFESIDRIYLVIILTMFILQDQLTLYNPAKQMCCVASPRLTTQMHSGAVVTPSANTRLLS